MRVDGPGKGRKDQNGAKIGKWSKTVGAIIVQEFSYSFDPDLTLGGQKWVQIEKWSKTVENRLFRSLCREFSLNQYTLPAFSGNTSVERSLLHALF